MPYLLDTDILIYLFKGNRAVAARMDAVGWSDIAISPISMGELFYGAYFSSERHFHENVKRCEVFLQTVQVLGLDAQCGRLYGYHKARLRQSGKLIDDNDLWIASVALAYRCTLVTNNVKHFSRITDLKIENWVESTK